jgi:hypothetical protein
LNDLQTAMPVKAHRGLMLFIFGLASLVPSPLFLFGIAAWIMGSGDLKLMAEGKMDPAGEHLTKAGRVLGILGILVNLLWISKMIFIDGVGRVVGTH